MVCIKYVLRSSAQASVIVHMPTVRFYRKQLTVGWSILKKGFEKYHNWKEKTGMVNTAAALVVYLCQGFSGIGIMIILKYDYVILINMIQINMYVI